MLASRIAEQSVETSVYTSTDIRQYSTAYQETLPTTGYSSRMEPSEFGAAMRAKRGPRDQTALAAKVGVKQATYSRMEAGDFKRFQPWMLEAARNVGLEVSPNDLGLRSIERYSLTTTNEVVSTTLHLDVYATVQSADNYGLVSDQPVDTAPMPLILANVKNAYGLLVGDDAMEPEYRKGDLALVHPYLPPVPSETCVFRDRRRGGRAILRRLIGETDTHWLLRRHNPPTDEKLAKSEWPICHQVVGRYNR